MSTYSELEKPLIFALDSSSATTSMAVTSRGHMLGGLGLRSNAARSERIWAEADFLLKEAGLVIADIDLFAVCTGPGGFTGIRVGMASAKGLAAAARRPLVGATSLQATALSASLIGPDGSAVSASAPILALIRAYRGEVYSQLFQVGASGALTELNEPIISPIDQALERVSNREKLVIVGDATDEHAGRILERAASFGQTIARERTEQQPLSREGSDDPSPAAEEPRPPIHQWWIARSSPLLAREVAQIAYARYVHGDVQSPADVKACYVRPSEAEIKLSQGLLGPGLGGKKG
jgi:tRNA threonylcarbamoyladenosine biosynthesis protein TsaB